MEINEILEDIKLFLDDKEIIHYHFDLSSYSDNEDLATIEIVIKEVKKEDD